MLNQKDLRSSVMIPDVRKVPVETIIFPDTALVVIMITNAVRAGKTAKQKKQPPRATAQSRVFREYNSEDAGFYFITRRLSTAHETNTSTGSCFIGIVFRGR